MNLIWGQDFYQEKIFQELYKIKLVFIIIKYEVKMKKNTIERIDVGISLADAELESYFYEKNKNHLVIKIKTWKSTIIQFTFFDLIIFVDRGGNFIMDFGRQTSENDVFKQALEKSYDKIPTNVPYKLFQFLDIGDTPYLEIVCEYFEFKVI